MIDGGRMEGRRWFHNGAFRQINLPYITTRRPPEVGGEVVVTHRDDYDSYLLAGSAGELGGRGHGAAGLRRKLLATRPTTPSGRSRHGPVLASRRSPSR